MTGRKEPCPHGIGGHADCSVCDNDPPPYREKNEIDMTTEVKVIKGYDVVVIQMSSDDYRMMKLALKHYGNSLTSTLLRKLEKEDKRSPGD